MIIPEVIALWLLSGRLMRKGYRKAGYAIRAGMVALIGYGAWLVYLNPRALYVIVPIMATSVTVGALHKRHKRQTAESR